MTIHRITARTAAALARLDSSRDPAVVRQARTIVDDVRERGETALREWTRLLDDVRPPFAIGRRELHRAWNQTPRPLRRAIETSIRNARRVAERQMPAPSTVRVDDGVRVESRVTALSRVACYVPGGRFPLPSTAIMTVVPATVAGVKDIAVVCPSPAPVVLAAALAAGATSVHRLGGAQAIAAAAYGTRSLPRVDKIVGPGNRWVTAAKMLVAGDCAIDFRAGPSEIVIWSDAGRPDWIAHDLAAQAEHDPDARAILLTTRLSLAKNVHARLLVIGLAANVSIHVGNRRQIVALINELSPEHLVVDRAPDADECIAATTFVGEWSAQASGDYCTGSNHVLPTGGGARTRGGLTPADFVRVSTVQRLTRRGLRGIGPAVVTLARAEGLRAHARSIEVRLEDTGR